MAAKRKDSTTRPSRKSKRSKVTSEASTRPPRKSNRSKMTTEASTRPLRKSKRSNIQIVEEEVPDVEISEGEEPEMLFGEEEEQEIQVGEEDQFNPLPRSRRVKRSKPKNGQNDVNESRFIEDPVEDDKARRRWPHRYLDQRRGKEIGGSDSTEEKIQARRHFTRALVDGHMYFDLGDDAYVMPGKDEDDYICRIVEMFEGVDGEPYFTAQWFYRAKDTVIKKECSKLIDEKRVFLSAIKDDNPLECLLKKIKIVHLPLNVDLDAQRTEISECNYYYDMMYHVPFSSFVKAQHDSVGDGNESDSTISTDSSDADVPQVEEHKKVKDMKLLDLFSGCGAMSTGLCLGANISGVHLVTKWAVDINQYACQSLKLNHPETEVRNEKAEDFLALLKEWYKLCLSFSLIESSDPQQQHTAPTENENPVDDDANEEATDDDEEDDPEVFEVEEVLSICYGDPRKTDKSGLHLKIRWKGYRAEYDTWEPIDGLGGCQEKIKAFVTNGYKSNMLPLPGDVDVICGGPPCQGISGYNRYRNTAEPLADEKNRQLVVFMDIVNYLKPRFVLMENVVDIVKFARGFLGRYALARLVGMNYQVRMGMMAAGAYGLPQFRMRMFMWGAHHTEKLPQYPLPTHDVVVRGITLTEYESNAVAYDEGHMVELEKKLFLRDAISDLPPVKNDEARDAMPYHSEPKTEFQRFIRSRKDEMQGFATLELEPSKPVLFDHRPLKLNIDDYQRVCQIPKRKGANFRDLKGVRVGVDNKVEFDPKVERVILPSGKPLVPKYAMTYVKGTSLKPFSRLWWDETVPTVVTRAEPHNQTIMHPEQDRVLTIRENARLQGFPDFYQLCGPIKQRYIQVGNAVAVPVARALGFSLALAAKGGSTEEPLFTLPKKFPNIEGRRSPALDED